MTIDGGVTVRDSDCCIAVWNSEALEGRDRQVAKRRAASNAPGSSKSDLDAFPLTPPV